MTIDSNKQEKADELMKLQTHCHELEQQLKQYKDRHERFMQSLIYAKSIQEAILPSKKILQKYFPDSFVFDRARDVVSGDFFWFKEKGNKLYIASVDCTGHGVPGAFMSLIGNDLMDSVINLLGMDSPGLFLSVLDKSIRALLRHEQKDRQDGMDMSLCIVDLERNSMQFAAARHNMMYMKEGELHRLKGDRLSIGGTEWDIEDKQFTNHKVALEPGMAFYMFSDGYQDQFGGPDKFKFTQKRMGREFTQIVNNPMPAQKKHMVQLFDKWRGSEKQYDDVLLIGFRIP